MDRHLLLALFIGLAVGAMLPDEALAQQRCGIDTTNNALDCVLETFRTKTATWEAGLKESALRLFWILAGIEFTFAALLLAFRGADLSEWMSSLLNQVLFIGFFALLLDKSSEWAGLIVNSFRQAATAAGGVDLIKPSNIFDVGIRLASALYSASSSWNPAHNLVLAIAAFFLIISFALIAAALIVALVESYIVISASVLFMGFGGSRWTKDYAVRTFQYCLSVGAKLFVIQLLAGLLTSIVEPWTSVAAESSTLSSASLTSIFVLVGVSLVFVSITKVIPELVQALINGTSLASGAGLYGTTVGLATGAVAAAAGGAMAVYSAGALAAEQMRSENGGPSGWGSWTAGFAARTAANMGIYAASNVGDRLSGRAAHGTRFGQQSAAMDRARHAMEADRKEGGAGGTQQGNRSGRAQGSPPPNAGGSRDRGALREAPAQLPAPPPRLPPPGRT